MSRPAGELVHPVTRERIQTYEGFSWPAFFAGVFWYAYKGMIGWAALALVLALVTFGFSWLVLPFFANRQHRDHVLKQGYVTDEYLARSGDVTAGVAG